MSESKPIGMRMAKATEDDAEAMLRLYRLVSAVEGGNFPPEEEDGDWPVFNEDNTAHLQDFLDRVLDCFNNPPSGFMRILMAATAALDPKNRILDPDKDYLAFHPRIEAADEALEALRRAEVKLSAYVGAYKEDKELTGAVLPMVRDAITKLEALS